MDPALLHDLELITGDPGQCVVATDFDGSLAPIVDHPPDARPLPGSMECLSDLSRRIAEVAVISGRPLSFIERFAPEGITIFGLYGLEVSRFGERSEHPEAAGWRQAASEAATEAEAASIESMLVELKGTSLTLHHRARPDAAAEVWELAQRLGSATGLEPRWARASVELHPPIGEDKGAVLGRLAEGRSGGVFFAGDDLGDLPAFAALDRIRETGRPTCSVAVASSEVPQEVLEAADHRVEDPDGLLAVLMALLDTLSD